MAIGRRQFISAIGGAAVAWPLVARAQHPSMPVVGYLGFSSSSEIGPRLAAFLAGLKENGYVDGQSLKIEYRWAEGQAQRIPAFAAELVHLHVAAIVAPGVARDAIEATKAIPIIFTTGAILSLSALSPASPIPAEMSRARRSIRRC
jgi:putative tryptophan/tyrosine transport system substrate-binding protein